MKQFIDKLLASFDDITTSFQKKHELKLKELENLRALLQKEIDDRLDAFHTKTNLVQEAFRQKTQLKQFKLSIFRQMLGARLRLLVSAPFIYAMIIPAIILHFFLELYHQICFPLFNIPKVSPKEYFTIDRTMLPYLNWFEKFNCIYCSYFNNLIGYTREVSARTERYWCPIKEAQRRHDPHGHYHMFFDYLDAKGYREKKMDLRCFDLDKSNEDSVQ